MVYSWPDLVAITRDQGLGISRHALCWVLSLKQARWHKQPSNQPQAMSLCVLYGRAQKKVWPARNFEFSSEFPHNSEIRKFFRVEPECNWLAMQPVSPNDICPELNTRPRIEPYACRSQYVGPSNSIDGTQSGHESKIEGPRMRWYCYYMHMLCMDVI
jgi:hypothetical protein